MTTSAPPKAESTMLYKRFMLQEAIKDIGAAVTQGILSNSAACDLAAAGESTRTSAAKTATGNNNSGNAGAQRPLDRMAYISATERMRKLQEGSKQMKRLFQEFTQMSDKSVGHGGEAAVAARATASREVFVRECGLEGNYDPIPTVDPSNPHNGQRRMQNAPEEVNKQLQPLLNMLLSIQALRKAPRFDYEKSLREQKQRGTSSLAAQHMHLIVKRLEESISNAVETIRAQASSKPVSSQAVKDVSQWPVDLLRIMTDTMNQKTMEMLTEAGREQLRRITFDVEELQHDQQQAVTDGDMQKSEQLYFEQTTLLETMKPQFTELEQIIERYKKERGEAVQESLKQFQKNFRQLLTTSIRREERDKRLTDGDTEKLTEKRSLVQKARKDQKANFTFYVQEWEKLFDTNVEQQAACYRAMEELERRIHQLSAEQAVLIADRVDKVNMERERALDAAAFFYFCDQRNKSSKESAQSSQSSVDTLKEVGQALEFSANQFDMYLKECIIDHSDAELLAIRQQKLAQFRQLYLTLGDLQFKKARHAEEIEKKIEYYSLQQEIAMDTLNPKAKEYSQAKKKWQCVKDEIGQQLNVLEQKSEREAADFKPTEVLLIKAGVTFKHPVEELREKNTIREQKLLEYKQLMDAKVEEQKEEQQKRGGAASSREDDDELMMKTNRSLSMSGSRSLRLQSSEEKKKPPPVAAKKRM